MANTNNVSVPPGPKLGSNTPSATELARKSPLKSAVIHLHICRVSTGIEYPSFIRRHYVPWRRSQLKILSVNPNDDQELLLPILGFFLPPTLKQINFGEERKGALRDLHQHLPCKRAWPESFCNEGAASWKRSNSTIRGKRAFILKGGLAAPLITWLSTSIHFPIDPKRRSSGCRLQ